MPYTDRRGRPEIVADPSLAAAAAPVCVVAADAASEADVPAAAAADS